MNNETSGEEFRDGLMDVLSKYMLENENSMMQSFIMVARTTDTESMEQEVWSIRSPGCTTTEAMGYLEFFRMREYAIYIDSLINPDTAAGQ